MAYRTFGKLRKRIGLIKCDETESLRENLVVYKIEDADVKNTK